MVTIKKNIANKSNYGDKRATSSIKYLVIHYTANDGDHDESNGNYFKNNIVKASAHYFVDSDSITQSVPDNYVAWSVGGEKWNDCAKTGGGSLYGKCMNSNSISIELCDDVKNGKVYPSNKTIENAIDLVESLMKKYGISASHVIRHFDVNGKHCPDYWCGTAAKNKKWLTAFHDKIGKTAGATKAAESAGNDSAKTDSVNYKVKVTASALNVRKTASTSAKITCVIKKGEVYTIVDEKTVSGLKWGKLKSGAGWISLKYTSRV